MRLRVAITTVLFSLPSVISPAHAGEVPQRAEAIRRLESFGAAVPPEEALQCSEVTEIIFGRRFRVFEPRPAFNDTNLDLLDSFPNLRKLHFVKGQITDNGLKGLRATGVLQRLTEFGTFGAITDAGAREFRGLSNLKSLVLVETSITDAGLKDIATLENLRTLKVPLSDITDAGLLHLRALRNLRQLDLSVTAITGAGLEALQGLTHLTDLSLIFAHPFEDRSLKFVGALPSLTSVNLRETWSSDAHIGELAHLKNLKSLDVGRTAVTAVGLNKLGGCRELRTLVARETDVGRSLTKLPQFPKLSELDLSYGSAKVDLEALVNYAPTLRSLKLAGTRIKSETFAALRRLRSLEELTLGLGEIDAAAFRELSRLDHLHSLSLRFVKLRPGALQSLPRMRQLRQLDLGSCGLTDLDLKPIAALTQLRELRLDNNPITDTGLVQLRPLDALTELDVAFTSVTGAAFKDLRGLRSLEFVSMMCCPLTDEGMLAVATLPHMTEISITQEDLTPRLRSKMGAVRPGVVLAAPLSNAWHSIAGDAR
jgi:internalin A